MIVRGALDISHAFAAEASLDSALAARLAVVVEELVANLIDHGGACEITLALEARDDAVLLTLQDSGSAFDIRVTEFPFVRDFDGPRPDTGGGVGLKLVRAWADILSYDHVPGSNRLVLRML